MAIDLTGYVRKTTKVNIGSEEFIFVELNLADMAEFRAHVKDKRRKINDERRKRLIADAAKIGGIDPAELLKITDTPVTEEEFQAESETIEGLGHLAYLSLKYKHPGIALNQVMQLITPNVLDKVTDAMFPELDLPKDSTSKTKKKKQSRK